MITHHKVVWWQWLLSGLVLIISLAFTYRFWQNASQHAEQQQQAEFEFRVKEANRRIAERMINYEEVLHGASGLFAAAPVDRLGFKNYVDALQLSKNFPGIQGVGFSLIVPAAQKADHVAAMRREGFPEYDIRPAGPRDPYTSIIYLEPFKDRNLRAFSYDMYSEPVRRETMEQARDTGLATLSGKVILVQEDNNSRIQAGCLMYQPVYRPGMPHGTVDERRAAILGWVYAPFRMGDLMEGLFGERANDFNINIYDGKTQTPQARLFDSDETPTRPRTPMFTALHCLQVAGHAWTVVISSHPVFEARQKSNQARFIASVGLGWGMLLALLLYVLLTGRQRAEILALQRTQALSRHDAILNAVSFTAEQFLEPIAWDDSMQRSLARLGEATECSRVYVFRKHSNPQGGLLASQTREWTRQDIDPQIGNPDLQNLPLVDAGFSRWAEKLSQGESIMGNVRDFPAGERAILEPQLIKTLLVVPIFTQQGWWGFMGYDDCKSERPWMPAEAEALRAAARIIGAALNRKMAVEALQKSEENLRRFFNTIDDFIFVLDQDGKILHTNDTVVTKLGYTEEELVGLHVLMVHPEARRDEALQIVLGMLAGTAKTCPVPLLAKNGQRVPVETRVVRGQWNGQDVLLGISKNISDLCASEEKFAKAFHGNPSPMAISRLDDDRFVDVNEAFLKTLGYQRHEVIGRSAGELHLFVDAEMRATAMRMFSEQGTLRGFEMAARAKDGQIRNGLFAADMIELQEQKLLLTVMTDITERKQAEIVQQKTKAQQKAILDNLPFLAWLKDSQGRFLEVNEPFAKSCGASEAEIVGKTDFDIWPQDLAQTYVDDDRWVMESGRKKQVEERIAAMAGSRWFETFKTPIYDAEHNLLGTTGFASDITERKENEEARRAIQARLERVVEGSNDGFWDWHVPSGRVIFSDRWQEMLGYEPGDVAPTPEGWSRLLHPDDREKALAAVADYWSGKSSKFELEVRMRTKSGGWRWVLSRGKVLNWVAPGQPEWMTGTHVNIHQRKWAEFLLEARNQMLEQLPNATSLEALLQPFVNHIRNIWPDSPLSIMLLDKSGQHLFNANSIGLPDFYCQAVNGMEIGPQRGSCGAAAYLGERVVAADLSTHPNWVAFRELASRAGLGACWSEPLRGLSGQVFGSIAIYSHTPMSPDEDDLRMLGEVAGVGSQAIERFHMGRELRASEARFRTICDNVPGWIIWQLQQTPGNSFQLTYVGGDTGNMLSGPASRVLDDFNLVKSVFAPDDYSRIAKTIIAAGDANQRIDQQVPITDLAGRHKWLHLRAAPHRQPNGETLWDGIAIDFTEMKRVEEELTRAKKAADNANLAKSLFLANMSHEIRTPMNAILGFVQLLQRDPEATPRQQQQFAAISRSGEHLLGLITGILEMSKIEAGRITLSPIRFNLQGWLDDLEVMFQIQTADKQISFSIERDPGLAGLIEADGVKLRQILINLVGNAVKFTQAGGVVLRVGTTPLPQGFMQLRIEVEDSGPGIAPEELHKLFQAFSQTGSGAGSSGTGLGLAISRQFAQIMGGDITVDSEPGKGSKFCLVIPVRPVSTAMEPTVSRLGQVLGLLPGQSARHILIVDDKEENRNVLDQILTSAGFLTCTATNGQDAIAKFAALRPDLIFMDMRMPVMDGATAMRQIRALADGQAVRIVALTAGAFEIDRQNAMEAGANAFIVKPFREAELFACIKELLHLSYIYAEPLAALGTAAPEALAVPLPEALAMQIRDATLDGDISRLLAVIDQLETTLPAPAACLRRFASNFDYERLLAWLDSAPPPPSTTPTEGHIP
jgi:PAS domain S-box-containing protein